MMIEIKKSQKTTAKSYVSWWLDGCSIESELNFIDMHEKTTMPNLLRNLHFLKKQIQFASTSFQRLMKLISGSKTDEIISRIDNFGSCHTIIADIDAGFYG